MLNVISLQKVHDLHSLSCFFTKNDSSVIELSGKDVIDLLNRLSTNDTNKLQPNDGIGTILTNNKGRIIDVLTLLNLNDNTLCIASENNATTVIQWVKKYIIMDDARLIDRSDDYVMFEVHGEQSYEILNTIADNEITITPLFHPQLCMFLGNIEATVFRIQSVRDLAYRIIIRTKFASELKELLSSKIPSVSESDYTIMKILHGIPSFGRELTEQYNPLEAGLIHLVNFKKGCYIGQEVIARLDSYNKVKQHLSGFVGTHPFAEGDSVQIEGKEIGIVTSTFTLSDSNVTYGLGYLRTEFLHEGTMVQINSNDVSIHLLPMKIDG